MPESTRRHVQPPYQGIIATDVENFSRRSSADNGIIAQAIPEILEKSFKLANIEDVWNDQRFPSQSGDGYSFGVDPCIIPSLINPWPRRLQETLLEFNRQSPESVRIRMRVSLHVGPLPNNEEHFSGVGASRNEAHRLLDSSPVRTALAKSNPNITQVAFILSERVYLDTVAGGWSDLHTDNLIPVWATVPEKSFEQCAWIYIPTQSSKLISQENDSYRTVLDQFERFRKNRHQGQHAPAPESTGSPWR